MSNEVYAWFMHENGPAISRIVWRKTNHIPVFHMHKTCGVSTTFRFEMTILTMGH